MEDGLVLVNRGPLSFQDALLQNLYWFLHPQSLCLDATGAHVVAQVAEMLAASYRQLSFPPQPLETVVKYVPPLAEADYLAADAQYRQPVMDLARFAQSRLVPYLSHLFLHGSLATLDYCRGWSDADTFLIVSRDTATDPRRLVELRSLLHESYSYLTAIDPLQHHGFIVATEIDLACYPTAHLPPVVLDTATSLLPGREEIVFQCRDCVDEIRGAIQSRVVLFRDAVTTGEFRHHARNKVYLQARWRNAHDAMYQLKYFLAVIMMQPVYYLEAESQACSKRDSFDLCRPLFPEYWDIIERASAVRRLWPERESHPFQSNTVPAWVRTVIGEDYFERGFALAQAIARRLAGIATR